MRNRPSKKMLAGAVRERNRFIFDKLIAEGCDVNEPDETGATPLAIAIRKGDEELAEALLDAGADPNVYCWPSEGGPKKGANHVMIDCLMTGCRRLLPKLIEAGGDLNVKSDNGDAPVMVAANMDIDPDGAFRTLVMAGADLQSAAPGGLEELVAVVRDGWGDRWASWTEERALDQQRKLSTNRSPRQERQEQAPGL